MLHQENVYKLDLIAIEMGHLVTKLLPYHSQYKPIKLIWTNVKGEITHFNIFI